MSIELRHLRTFVTLAEELHFGRAAARLHVVQSAVSQTLRALEDQLGFQLLHRTRRSVALSPAGERYLEHARRALAEIEEAAEQARRVAQGRVGMLRVQFTASGALTVLPKAIGRFRQAEPELAIQIEQAGSALQADAIRAGRCDVGVVVTTPADGRLACVRLTNEPLMALLSRDHRLAHRRRLRIEEVIHEPVILMSRRTEPSLYELYQQLCEPLGVTPQVVLETDQLEAMLAFVAVGVGLSFAPAAVCQLRHRGVVAIPLSPRFDSGTSVLWDPETLTPVGERFLAVLWDEQARAANPTSRGRRAKTRAVAPVKSPKAT